MCDAKVAARAGVFAAQVANGRLNVRTAARVRACVRACVCCVCHVRAPLEQAAPAMGRMPVQAAAVSGDRNMANVKALRLRLASVKSIQRITKTMKMVAAAKLKGFQTRMMNVRVFMLFCCFFSLRSMLLAIL
jgi:hypothetical protein